MIDEILKAIHDEEIMWMDLVIMDIKGFIHSVTLPARAFDERAFEYGLTKLDGSSIEGYKAVDESDLILKPIPETYTKLPFDPDGTGWMICQVYDPVSGGRLIYDPRYIAERCRGHLGRQGLKAYIGSEVEFFIFDKVSIDLDPLGYNQAVSIGSRESPMKGNGYPYMPNTAYYIPPPIDRYYRLKIETANLLREHFNVEIDALHHEVASSGQVEVDIRYDDLTASGDKLLTFKYVMKRIGEEYGLCPTFMAKPLASQNGSGLHIHQSLWSGSSNLFYDPDDEYAHLSQTARYYIGGLIEHGRSLSALVSPTLNSYKRLIPGFEAPIYLTWSRANRSAAIRIPMSQGQSSKRIEYRPPDPTCNPYIAYSAMVAAGLDGISKKIDPGDPIDKNIYKLSKHEKDKLGIRELPRDLWEALDELESDNEYLKPIFPTQFIERYIELKREEFKKVSIYPSPIEFLHYYHI